MQFAAIHVPLHGAEQSIPSAIQFNRDIRPILTDVCFHCHGPDKAKRQGNLRLDSEEAAKALRDGHAAIVAREPDKSELVRRIAARDPKLQMPPPHSGRSLSTAQIDLLRRWIEQGAKWQKHWAFIAPTHPELPKVKNERWVRNPIDRFILARLEREGYSPSPEASRSALLRRLSFDLTGLPPTPQQVDAFLSDRSQDAYEKCVDQLLASPRYGERMAWRWLEASRYADTSGYQSDGERDMWRWRDWVIEAYNRNLPFDQFTIEQLAGDLLPNPTLDQKIATGFNRNHRGNAEGGIVSEEYAVEYVVDRVETTATVWLGLTLGCTRCHDHKFDPFSQREFYQLFAYFNSVPEKGRAIKLGNSPPYIKAPTKEQEQERHRLRIAQVARAIAHDPREVEAAFTEWRKKNDVAADFDWVDDSKLVLHLALDGAGLENRDFLFRDGSRAFKSGRVGQAADLNGVRFIDAGNVGDFDFQDEFSFSLWINPRQENGAVISRMAEEPQSDGYGIHLVKGKLQVHLTKRWLDDALRVESTVRLETGRWQHVVVTYDGSREAGGVRIYVGGERVETKVLLDELNQTFKNDQPLRIGSGGGKESRFDGLIDDVRVYARALSADEAQILSVPEKVGELLRKGELLPAQRRKLLDCFERRFAPDQIRKRRQEYDRSKAELLAFEKTLPTVMVMEEMPVPRDTYVLMRGEYDKRGEKVTRAVPAALNPLPQGVANNRFGLARWLVDPSNPLTARVAVNRMWQLHFGAGLVKSVEDFGTQGEYPSHPELLDWLATEFVRSGWNVKQMHKTIVMSAAYRQSSAVRHLHADDPDNRLILRGPRYRLSAEMVRDQALFASGLLVEKLGGPSVKPYQPSGLWKELTGGSDYVPDRGKNLYRRSLYTYWKRTVAPPSLMSFDASTREFCSVRESRTNTPLQALTLLNDVTYVEAARLMAQRLLRDGKVSTEERLIRAFKLATSRAPRESELGVLKESLAHQLQSYRSTPEAAKKVLRVGEATVDPKLDAVELAAYTAVCSLILNLDETLTKE